MQARVFVTLKNGVLDPQGKAIEHALRGLGHDGVEKVRQGKMFEIELADTDAATAEQRLKVMCERLLANTVIENYRIEIGGEAVFAICNGFQMACEAGLLPGVLMNNAAGKYVCRHVAMRVEDTQSPFTTGYQEAQRISIPVAHHDGNYFADEATLDRLEGEGLVAFRYDNDNPNGSRRDIAGLLSANRRVLGMMPHPERAADPDLGGTDGAAMFRSLVENLA